MCVETTGASPEILEGLLSVRPCADIIVARVYAPLEVCLQRISGRDQTNQIPMEMDAIRVVHALSESLQLPADITLHNVRLEATEIARMFETALAAGRGGEPGGRPDPASRT